MWAVRSPQFTFIFGLGCRFQRKKCSAAASALSSFPIYQWTNSEALLMKNYVHNFQIYCRTSSLELDRGDRRRSVMMMGAVRTLKYVKMLPLPCGMLAAPCPDGTIIVSVTETLFQIFMMRLAEPKLHHALHSTSITPCSWFTVQKVISSFLLRSVPVKVLHFSPMALKCVVVWPINFHLVSTAFLGKYSISTQSFKSKQMP